MDNKEFVNAALKTESPVNSEMLARFHDAGAALKLAAYMFDAIQVGQALDQMKKHLFYGKPLPTFEATITELRDEIKDRLNEGNIRLLHSAIGMITEAAEIFIALRDHIYDGAVLDFTNLREEGGDMLWYHAIYADALSVTFEDLQDMCIRKLAKRYGGRFNEQGALIRNLPAERETLEKTGETGQTMEAVAPGATITTKTIEEVKDLITCKTNGGHLVHIKYVGNNLQTISGMIGPSTYAWDAKSGKVISGPSRSKDWNLDLSTKEPK